MAGAPPAGALDEGRGAEVLQAGAGAGQVLAGALRAGVGVLELRSKLLLVAYFKRTFPFISMI